MAKVAKRSDLVLEEDRQEFEQAFGEGFDSKEINSRGHFDGGVWRDDFLLPALISPLWLPLCHCLVTVGMNRSLFVSCNNAKWMGGRGKEANSVGSGAATR